MTQFVPISQLSPSPAATAAVQIFDPPMCCPTGLCGPTLDESLLDLNETVLKLQSEGISVARYQMTSQPYAFLSNPEVMKLVREQQMTALPITVVHNKIIKTGAYPTYAEIQASLNGATK